MVVHQFLPKHQSGAELYTYYLSKELIKRHDVYLLYADKDSKKEDYALRRGVFDGIPFLEVTNNNTEFKNSYSNPHVDKVFEDLVKEFKPDVIHFQHLLNLSVNLVAIAKKKGIPSVMTLHEYWLMCPWLGQRLKKDLTLCHDIALTECAECMKDMYYINFNNGTLDKIFNLAGKKKGLRKISRLLSRIILRVRDAGSYERSSRERVKHIKGVLSEVDLFVAPSPFLRKEFIKFGIPEEKIIFSDYGMNKGPYGDILRKESEAVCFSFIGSPLEHKGVHILVDAFNGIKDCTAELNIYGDMSLHSRYSNKLLRMARHPNIHFKGRIANNQIADILAKSDVLVVPSIWFENSPLTIHEAFMAGIPVITSNIGGMADLVQHGVNGLLFEVGNANDLRDKINSIVNDRGLIEKLIKGIPHIKTIEEDAGEMEVLYKRLLTDVM